MARSTRSPQPVMALLALRGIPQTRVAADLGISTAWVNHVVNGRQRPSEHLKARFAEYLDVPADQLFAVDDEQVVIQFVRRTTAASGVPERLEDAGTAEGIAHALRGAG